ncbi:Uncharacterised protein [Mycobacterium tuberculosis]|nr:Uncharacterised protein [Mycobacterium tuberculosis]
MDGLGLGRRTMTAGFQPSDEFGNVLIPVL